MNNENSEEEPLETIAGTIGDNESEEGFGDDFDDFEAGAVDEDFGDFDEGFEEPSSPQKHKPDPASSDQVHVSSISPFVSRSNHRIYPSSYMAACSHCPVLRQT